MDGTGLADTSLYNDLNTGPGTGARGDHQCRGLTPIHIGGLTHSPRNQSKNFRSPTLTRRRRKTKELFPKGYKNDADRTVCHAAYQLSRKTDKVYAGETPADQESRRARKEPRGDCRVDRRDRWFPASHLFK